MAELTKRDLPGLLRLAVQVPLLVAGFAAAAHFGARGSPVLAVLAAAVAGLGLLCHFPSLHESGHGPAFRTRWLNESVAWVSAVLMLQSPTFFREFHWEHHRHTQDPLRDPEIAAMPALLSPFPRNPLVYLLLASGQSLLVGKTLFTVGALGQSASPRSQSSSRGSARTFAAAYGGRARWWWRCWAAR